VEGSANWALEEVGKIIVLLMLEMRIASGREIDPEASRDRPGDGRIDAQGLARSGVAWAAPVRQDELRIDATDRWRKDRQRLV
jgi:hypothetical protein